MRLIQGRASCNCYFSMACYSIVSYWCRWCMLPCSQQALILVQTCGKCWHYCCLDVAAMASVYIYFKILSLYATGWPVFPKCMQLTKVSWSVTSMLCCHWWRLSLSDALPMQSYPSKVWVLCQCGITYLCSFLPIYVSTWNRWYIMANTLKMLTSQLLNVCFNSWI